MKKSLIFSLAQYGRISTTLLKRRGARLGDFSIARYSNSQLHARIKTKVTGKQCVVFGDTSSDEGILKLSLFCHTLKKEGARKIIAVIPYLAYARQDENEAGKSWGVRWLGEMLKVCGVSRVIVADIHSQKAKKNFSLPIVSLDASKLFARALKLSAKDRITFVAPDEGAIDNCEALRLASGIKAGIAYFRKERSQKGIKILSLHGNVAGRAILVDDILDTGETLIKCAEKLRASEVRKMTVVVTHGLFSGSVWRRLFKLGVDKIYCTDSVRHTALGAYAKNIKILPLAELIDERLYRY